MFHRLVSDGELGKVVANHLGLEKKIINSELVQDMKVNNWRKEMCCFWQLLHETYGRCVQILTGTENIVKKDTESMPRTFKRNSHIQH